MDNSCQKVALVGAGMVAGTHVAACLEATNVRLQGVWSRSADKAAALAQSASEQAGRALHAYTSLEAIAASDVDLAIILTPPNARLSVIEPLARAGKHILLEKPIGRTAQEARAVVRACQDAGVRLGVVFQHRMRAASLTAKALIEQGQFGALGLVEIAVPWWRDQGYYDAPGRGTYARDGGGVLISQAIHTIDLALHLAGPVASVRAMATTTRFHAMEAEDFVVAGLHFRSGAAGALTASTASFPGGAESIRLHFDHASLHLEAGVLRVHWRDGRQEVHGQETTTGGGADPMAFTHAWHQAVIEDFAQAVHDNRPPAIPGDAGLPAHDLIDAMTRAARAGTTEELPE